MNKKQVPVFGDAHFGIKNGDRNLCIQMIDFLIQDFFSYILKNKQDIEFVIWLGDLFDSREFINVFVLQEVKQKVIEFFEREKIKAYFIVGNHDLFFKDSDSHSSLLVFDKQYEYVEVVMKNKVVEFAGKKFELCGYLSQPQKIGDYLFGHFDIKTFKMNQYTESSSGYEPVFFSDYEKVKTGHYHTASRKHNIEYIGSLFWLDKNDYGDIKKIKIIYDDFEEDNVYNTKSPRFIKVNYNEKNSNLMIQIEGFENITKTFNNIDEALQKIKDNYVLLTIEDYEDVSLLDEFKDKISRLYEVLNKKVISPNGQLRKKVTYNDLRSGICSYFDETVFPDNIDLKKIRNKTLELYDDALKEV